MRSEIAQQLTLAELTGISKKYQRKLQNNLPFFYFYDDSLLLKACHGKRVDICMYSKAEARTYIYLKFS